MLSILSMLATPQAAKKEKAQMQENRKEELKKSARTPSEAGAARGQLGRLI